MLGRLTSKFWFLSIVLFQTICCGDEAQNYIVVNKGNVEHKFVPFNPKIDNFVKNIFVGWERETFEVFEKVKDKQKIVIDLGAWIGTTSIWLSKNFYYVIAAEPDVVSLVCLENNLKASECSNVSICRNPVSNVKETLIFGPRGTELNDSISYIKPVSDNPRDYTVTSTTFEELISDYVYQNPALDGHAISFIKCDIEGGEENILGDVLLFAYRNDCNVYMSFHLDWWKSKTLNDYEYLFNYFEIGCTSQELVQHIKRNPFTSILFKPKKGPGVL